MSLASPVPDNESLVMAAATGGSLLDDSLEESAAAATDAPLSFKQAHTVVTEELGNSLDLEENEAVAKTISPKEPDHAQGAPPTSQEEEGRKIVPCFSKKRKKSPLDARPLMTKGVSLTVNKLKPTLAPPTVNMIPSATPTACISPETKKVVPKQSVAGAGKKPPSKKKQRQKVVKRDNESADIKRFRKAEKKFLNKLERRKKLIEKKDKLKEESVSKCCTVTVQTESVVSFPSDDDMLTPPTDSWQTPPMQEAVTQDSTQSEAASVTEEVPPVVTSQCSSVQSRETPPPSDKEEGEGLWVQCDRPECLKWRYLTDITDPANVPDKWYCSMNTDPKHNSCEANEEAWSSLEEYVYSAYVPGSLLLAKLEGYPWWPALIEPDPDRDCFYEAEASIPVRYHVVFFDTPVSRGWVHALNTAPFTRTTSIADCGSAIPPKYHNSLSLALSQAHAALLLSLNDRLSQWGFTHRYGNRKKRANPSKKSTTELSSVKKKRKALSSNKENRPSNH